MSAAFRAPCLSLYKISAEFAVLARTWGLFGGALDSPQGPAAATAASATPSTLSKDNGAEAWGAEAEETTPEGGIRGQRTPRLQVSTPVRATPHVASLGYHRDDHPRAGADPEAMGQRTPPPPAGDDEDDDTSDAGSRSPELEMLFTDEVEGAGPEPVVPGHGGAEASETGHWASR